MWVRKTAACLLICITQINLVHPINSQVLTYQIILRAYLQPLPFLLCNNSVNSIPEWLYWSFEGGFPRVVPGLIYDCISWPYLLFANAFLNRFFFCRLHSLVFLFLTFAILLYYSFCILCGTDLHNSSGIFTFCNENGAYCTWKEERKGSIAFLLCRILLNFISLLKLWID